MHFLYNISVLLYALGIRIAALFNSKARRWLMGRKGIFSELAAAFNGNEKIIWFHCASLGEFEQGRPVLEALKERYKDHKILLTFFSPSGYEVRQNYAQADYVFYLPLDTAQNARKFITLTRPRLAVFVKYEFWFNYLRELSRNKIPLLMVSVIFRPSQHFFRPWGRWFRRQLQKVTYFFVQNQDSKDLLSTVKVFHVGVSGDTRFDRVLQLADEEMKLPVMEAFSGGSPLLVAGSTWPSDEDLLKSLLEQSEQSFKLVLAPHLVDKEHIQQILEKFSSWQPVLFSQQKDADFAESRVLVIDSIGMLSGLYRFAKIAYIGGGFGAGIHNVLEAATYGLPVIFGTNYKRFQEAVQLSELGGGFPVENSSECLSAFNRLMTDTVFCSNSADISRKFVVNNAGATGRVVEKVKEYL